MCEIEEIYAKQIRGVRPAKSGPVLSPGAEMSHADLFGPYAIALDPVKARRIGLAPTKYFTRSNIKGHRHRDDTGEVAGLDTQVLQRLMEIRELCTILSYIERSLADDGRKEHSNSIFPSEQLLKDLGIIPLIEEDRLNDLLSLSVDERVSIAKHFWTKRVRGIDLISFVDMLLGLFQETDSKEGDDLLAFYQQREWRLVHHMRHGNIWYSPGRIHPITNPLARLRIEEMNFIRQSVNFIRGATSEEYFRGCWLLESADGLQAKDFVTHVIVPSAALFDARQILDRYGSRAVQRCCGRGG